MILPNVFPVSRAAVFQKFISLSYLLFFAGFSLSWIENLPPKFPQDEAVLPSEGSLFWSFLFAN